MANNCHIKCIFENEHRFVPSEHHFAWRGGGVEVLDHPVLEEFQMKSNSNEFAELNEWPLYVDDSVLKEPGVIKSAKEKGEENKFAVLDLDLDVNRKRKKIEFKVHYLKTSS